MQPANDVRAIVTRAEEAMVRGDNAGAERLLREALSLQETSLGAQHPEVANTLNNLAIVCEMNGKLVDAEACYRRGYAIATASLPPSDPFVATSRDNLEEFCRARGIPLMQSPPPQAAVPAVPTQKDAPTQVKVPPAPLPPPRPASSAPPPPAPPRTASAVPANPRTFTALAAVREPSRVPAIALALAALVVLLVVGWFLVETQQQPVRTASAPTPTPAPPPDAPTTPPASTADASKTPPAAAASDAAPPAAAPPAPAPRSVESAPPTPARAPSRDGAPAAGKRSASLSVVNAQVCRNLATSGAWTCTPATAEQGPGTMYFYTRVASPTDTVIEHRWYRDDRLQQRVPLRIRANPSGFRTYSRTTVTADRSGKWKVELRTPDGEILDTQTFAVR